MKFILVVELFVGEFFPDKSYGRCGKDVLLRADLRLSSPNQSMYICGRILLSTNIRDKKDLFVNSSIMENCCPSGMC